MRRALIIAAIAVLGLVPILYYVYHRFTAEEYILIATWNVRGYPEIKRANRDWFHEKLIKMSPDIICIQEIANQNRVDKFLANEDRFTSAAFLNSSDGQDNAIFTVPWVQVEDLPDPNGFQHPAQAAYVAYLGFDAVIVTVHLSWSDMEMREQENALLKGVVTEMLKKDDDVIITGDFNTKEKGMQKLAESTGMKVMVSLEQEAQGSTHAGNRYDHFLISPDLANEEAVSCWVHCFIGDDLETAEEISDHLPVLALFRTDSQYKDRD